MKKVLIYMLCTLMLLAFCACGSTALPESGPSEITAPSPSTTPEPTPDSSMPAFSAEEKTLVCIGDSIASGFALPNEELRFSALVADGLSDGSELWTEVNYAVPGHTGSDMVSLLNSGGAPKLGEADLILVCIGANNVLRPAQTFLMKYGSYSFALSAGEEPLLSPEDIRTAYEDFRTAAEANAEALRDELAASMEYIRRENSEARIIFMTVYNPYKTNTTEIDLGGFPIPMNVMSDTFVTLVNDVLTEQADILGYELAEVYGAFEAAEDYLVNGDGSPSFIADPHPNSAGHELIAEVFLQVIAEA